MGVTHPLVTTGHLFENELGAELDVVFYFYPSGPSDNGLCEKLSLRFVHAF